MKAIGVLAKLIAAAGSALVLKEDGMVAIVCATSLVLVILLNDRAYRRAKELLLVLLTARPPTK